ncbi:DUF397 domain-containing protein [Actinomadura parmotrematis]|uniref:DUF397 domain-containing protein n=1 Tax=Actinomadura parmotrematis TaxID=2864039 RepID=A0ABS7FUZ7_9ACTN|nr:DUF397 domain-containing protein [Actinomadura parmotrematis]MBW8484236.1 DUF397 domain-containing protein [Actinomadura parmotrematis]
MDLNAMTWRKSSRSGGNGGECVELAAMRGSVAVRDSKDPEGDRILLDRANFRRLANAVKEL